jgi:acyl transferase domain-containing protein
MTRDAATNRLSDNSSEPFAIVGISFKGPQEAVGEDGLWDVLKARKNLMTEWPEERTTVDTFYDGDSKRPNKVCQSYICSSCLPASRKIWVR